MAIAYKYANGKAFSETQDIKVFSRLVECMLLVQSKDWLGASIKFDSLSEVEKSVFIDLTTGQNILSKHLTELAKAHTSQSHLNALRQQKKQATHIKRRLLIALLCKLDSSYTPHELKGIKLHTLERLAINKAKSANSDMLNVVLKINFLTN